MNWPWILGGWTTVAALWWGLAVLLAATARSRPPEDDAPADRRTLTVFKPLASPLDPAELKRLLPCVESFIADLDETSELLIGCQEPERIALLRFVESMRDRHPSARVELIVVPDLVAWPNPKVGMLRMMARHADGELWLWSDSDMIAPPGTIRSLRADFADSGGRLVTSPYVLRDGSEGGLLDELFVNVELYPGVVLLGRLDRIRFGLGSGMLFESKTFRRHVDWEVLGSTLADDYLVGNRLGPGRLGSVRLETLAAARDGWRALLHYLRWQKTIRWCRPGGFAARLLVLPVLGWLAWAAIEPARLLPWLGALGVLALDSVAAVTISRAMDCPISPRRLATLPLWSLLRGLSWLASWLPVPVVWRGRRWRMPKTQPVLPTPKISQGQEDVD
jgi:ceramide glucosyltransferase